MILGGIIIKTIALRIGIRNDERCFGIFFYWSQIGILNPTVYYSSLVLQKNFTKIYIIQDL
jgi:hypothetical protein